MKLSQFIVLLAVLVFWAIGDLYGMFNSDVIPPILDVGAALGTVFQRTEFLPSLWLTIRDSLFSVIIATSLAIPLGLLIGMSSKIELSTRVLLDFGRTFPMIALIPIFILLIGTNHIMKIVITSMACFFPILVQTIYGARRLDTTVEDTVTSFQIPAMMRFTRVVFPSAMPYIATGIRLSLSISILVAIAVEVFTQVPGIGSLIGLAQTYNETAVAFLYVIIAGLAGVSVTGLWDLLETRLLAWHHRGEKS